MNNKLSPRLPLLVFGLFILAGTAFPQTSTSAVTAAPPALEPKALAILKASSDRLAAAHTMSFTALETYESPSRQGHPLVYANKFEVTLQRPDKLRVIMPGDGPASEFYYNGKTMTAFAPAEKLIAVTDAPPTIDAAMEANFHLSGTYFPFDDLIVTDPYKDMAEGLKLAYYIGQSHIAGDIGQSHIGDPTTDMVAYIDKRSLHTGVDWGGRQAAASDPCDLLG